jgi:ketosteroid isomerase-like protein
MHPHETLLRRLYDALNAHDHPTMGACYHEDATFRDIAFDLRGRQQIHAMWDMFCTLDEKKQSSEIQVQVEELSTTESEGRSRVVMTYIFRKTGRRVENAIRSEFLFRDGLIIAEIDQCDVKSWAHQAFEKGLSRLLMQHVGPFRRWKSMGILRKKYPDAFR